MSRTTGHDGSRHVYWKHQSSHSSNKLNKKDSHKRRRTAVRGMLYDVNNIINRNIDTIDIPKYDHKKGGGIGLWY